MANDVSLDITPFEGGLWLFISVRPADTPALMHGELPGLPFVWLDWAGQAPVSRDYPVPLGRERFWRERSNPHWFPREWWPLMCRTMKPKQHQSACLSCGGVQTQALSFSYGVSDLNILELTPLLLFLQHLFNLVRLPTNSVKLYVEHLAKASLTNTLLSKGGQLNQPRPMKPGPEKQ